MAFTEIDEKLLVRAYQAGDERAFDTIVRTQYQALYAHALRRLSQHEAAEDAVQDTLLRAYRALPNLDGDLALKAWLHRILTNVCHDEGNRRRRQQGLVEKVAALPEETAEDIANEAVLHDTVRIMSEALQDLPESYREALVLRYVDGLSFREVAEATGVTEENARARVHRGRQALHKIMSRVAVLAAFIIPGLKRTHHAATGAEQAVVTPGLSEQTVSLTTQLTTHAVHAAPAVSRLAEMSAALPGGKSTLAAAAVTAMAAVSVPVAYTVNEARKPEPRPAAVASPAPESGFQGDAVTDPTPGGPGTAVRPDPSTTTSAPVTTSTSTTLPPSLAKPFEPTGSTSTTVTTTVVLPPSTTTSTTQPVEEGKVVEGQVTAEVEVEGAAPQYDLDGTVTLTVDGRRLTGRLTGRVYVNDDGTAGADRLSLDLGERTLNLRFRGRATTTSADGTTTSELSGMYVLEGGAEVGLAERGDLLGRLLRDDAGSGALQLTLRGRSAS